MLDHFGRLTACYIVQTTAAFQNTTIMAGNVPSPAGPDADPAGELPTIA
jgi:hypothetical protein